MSRINRTQLYDPKLAERLSKSPCTQEEMAALQPALQNALLQAYSSPVLYATGGGNTDLLAFDLNYAGGPRLAAAGIFFAKCVGGVLAQPSADNQWLGAIKGLPCANILGEHPEAQTELFMVRSRNGQTISFAEGDVFSWGFDGQGRRVVYTGSGMTQPGTTDKQLWAKLTSDPTGNTASAQLCDNAAGDNPSTAITVIFPQRVGHGTAINSGAVVGVNLMTDDTYACTSDYSAATYYENGTLVATAPKVDFKDTTYATWSSAESEGKVEYQVTISFPAHPTFIAEWAAVELTEDKPLFSADASVSEYGGAEYAINTPGANVDVWDLDEIFPHALDGAKGHALYDRLSERHTLVQCQQMVQRIHGTIPAMNSGRGLLSTDTSFEVEIANIKGMTFSPFNQMPTAAGETPKITVQNVYGMSVAVGGRFDAEWCEHDGAWEMVQGAGRCSDPPEGA